MISKQLIFFENIPDAMDINMCQNIHQHIDWKSFPEISKSIYLFKETNTKNDTVWIYTLEYAMGPEL